MRVLIIEDETAAAKNLSMLLGSADPSIEIVDVIDTVIDTVQWLGVNPAPDIIFMDIHLADGSAFNIFEQTEVTSPIIFTTAYDQYALEAFKVNSIDYILKPIKTDELKRALDKFKRFSKAEIAQYVERTNSGFINKINSFLISVRDRLVPLDVKDIAYFYTSNEKVIAVSMDNKPYPIDKSLDQLVPILDEHDFFRANRQFIISRNAVNDLSVWFGSRLSLNMKVETPEKIIVSKARVPELKKWLTGV